VSVGFVICGCVMCGVCNVWVCTCMGIVMCVKDFSCNL